MNQGLRGGKVIELKKTVDQAVKQCPGVKRVLVSMRTDSKVAMTALDVPLEEVRCCPALLLLPLGNVSTLGAGTGGGEKVLAGHESFAGIDMMWGHCPTAAVAAGAAHKFRIVPGTIRRGNWWLFPQHHPCTVRGQAVQTRAHSRVHQGLETHQTQADTLRVQPWTATALSHTALLAGLAPSVSAAGSRCPRKQAVRLLMCPLFVACRMARLPAWSTVSEEVSAFRAFLLAPWSRTEVSLPLLIPSASN